MASRKAKPPVVPDSIAVEIEALAAKTGRSVAFVVLRTLVASPASAEVTEPSRALPLTTGEDDPRDVGSRIQKAGGDALARRIAGAWPETRERWRVMAEREATAGRRDKNDELDRALSEASAPSTAPERLRALAKSDFPKVRALVAANPATPAELVEGLAKDRERTVREAALARKT